MNILLAGVGGQGTVLASRLLAQCGMDRGEAAHTAETIGMAQRGGSVVSHVRIGEGMYSPLIPKGTADVLIGFEPAEAVRCFDYLKQSGAVVVSDRPIRPASSLISGTRYEAGDMLEFLKNKAGRLLIVDTGTLSREGLPARALNVALLGAAAACDALGWSEEDLAAAMRKLLPEKHWEDNVRALRLGAQCSNVHRDGV